MKHTITYNLGRYQLRINIWLLMVFLMMQTLLNELGFWQINRAKEKQQRIVLLAKGSENPMLGLSVVSAQDLAQFQSVMLATHMLEDKVLLLDNKINNKRPGYQVMHLVEDKISGKKVLVNRGWIAAGPDRSKMPEVELPPVEWDIQGRIYPIGEAAIDLPGANIEEQGRYLRLPVLNNKIKQALQGQFNTEIEPYVIRLNDKSTAALNTNWVWTNMPPDKHLAYAIQWFALALALLVVSLIASIKRR